MFEPLANAALSASSRIWDEAWLRVNALEFSPKRSHALLTAFGEDPVALFSSSDNEWRQRVPSLTEKHLTQIRAVQSRDISLDWERLEKAGAHVVGWNHPAYPAGLKVLPDAPLVLLVRGNLVPEDKFSIAIVGSRRASSYGLQLAKRFARDLAAQGLTIVSGGARGVDTLAHQGALEAKGRTIAFLGSGVDTPCTESPIKSENSPCWNTISAPPLRQITFSTSIPSASRFS